MLILQIALGVFLGALAFHYRKQLAPVVGALVALALLAGGAFAYYLFTTPAQRHEHFQGVIVWGVIIVGAGVVMFALQTPAGARVSAWVAEANQRWNRQRPWHQVAIMLGVGALLILAPVLLTPADIRVPVAAMLVASTTILVGAGGALNWINRRSAKNPAAPKVPDA